VDEHMIPQMKDLVTRYKPDILWGDGQWAYSSDKWKMPQFMAWLFNESAVKDSIVINDRWGKDTWGEHGGYLTVEYGNMKDQTADLKSISKPWEECKGMGFSFGYNKNESLEDYSTSEQLIHDLIHKVSMGGNLLLNIGATADGRIPVIMQQRLADIGGWLKVNGEGIYSTRKWEKAPPVKPETIVYFTKKGNDLYVIVTKWQDKPIVVENVGNPKSISLLGFSGKVKFSFSGKKLTITPPAISPASNPYQYAWVYKLNYVNLKYHF
jgi:alpha-L-fucosidase